MSENEIKTAAEETVADGKKKTSRIPEITAEVAPEIAQAESTNAVPVEMPKEESVSPEEISYHAVEKEGEITAIWEMQGQKHLRTIDPRSKEGHQIFSLFTSEIHETDSPPMVSEATT